VVRRRPHASKSPALPPQNRVVPVPAHPGRDGRMRATITIRGRQEIGTDGSVHRKGQSLSRSARTLSDCPTLLRFSFPFELGISTLLLLSSSWLTARDERLMGDPHP
jgi:hypothetical protein